MLFIMFTVDSGKGALMQGDAKKWQEHGASFHRHVRKAFPQMLAVPNNSETELCYNKMRVLKKIFQQWRLSAPRQHYLRGQFSPSIYSGDHSFYNCQNPQCVLQKWELGQPIDQSLFVFDAKTNRMMRLGAPPQMTYPTSRRKKLAKLHEVRTYS
jgi:hypothetical protein